MELQVVWNALRQLGTGWWQQPVLQHRAVIFPQPTLFDFIPEWQWLHLDKMVGRWLWPDDLRVSFYVDWGGRLDSEWFQSAGFVCAEIVNVVGCFNREPVAAVSGVALWNAYTESSIEESMGANGPSVPTDADCSPEKDLSWDPDAEGDGDDDDEVEEDLEEEHWEPDVVVPFPNELGLIEAWRMRTLAVALSTIDGVSVSNSLEQLRTACHALGLSVVD